MDNTSELTQTPYPADKELSVGGVHEGWGNLENDVVFMSSLQELPAIPKQLNRLGHNVIVNCTCGRLELEVGGSFSEGRESTQEHKIKAEKGQLLLLPSHKLLQLMMVSTDIEASVLLVSDKVLREILGPQINLWNRAVFLEKIYVIDGGLWTKEMDSYARMLFQDHGDRHFHLFRELVLSFLRTMFLMICETLIIKSTTTHEMPSCKSSTFSEHATFDRFLELLSNEPVKRQQVSYYASRLNITPKYLSTVCNHVSGKSPNRWITESVMDDCYQLLRNSNMSVKEISNKLGFPNSSFFCQYFRIEAGMTPLEYRHTANLNR